MSIILWFTGMSWADQMDTLDKLEELMALDDSSKGKHYFNMRLFRDVN